MEAIAPIFPAYRDRGVKESKSLCVLRKTAMPAVLVELGFIDSEDAKILKTCQENMARALAMGVMEYWQTI